MSDPKVAALKSAIKRAAKWNGRGKLGMDRYEVVVQRYVGLWRAANRRTRIAIKRRRRAEAMQRLSAE